MQNGSLPSFSWWVNGIDWMLLNGFSIVVLTSIHILAAEEVFIIKSVTHRDFNEMIKVIHSKVFTLLSYLIWYIATGDGCSHNLSVNVECAFECLLVILDVHILISKIQRMRNWLALSFFFPFFLWQIFVCLRVLLFPPFSYVSPWMVRN